MPFIPFAAFLAGALLTILLPLGLLIVLSAWYWLFSARVPETTTRSATQAPQANPGPAIPEPLPPDPAA